MGEPDRTSDLSFGPPGRSSAALNDDFVDICDFQQFATDGVEACPSKRADLQTFDMGTIDVHDTPGDGDAPDEAQRSCRSGDDENLNGMLRIVNFDRDLATRPHVMYAISV
jgi:hypothetical protein